MRSLYTPMIPIGIPSKRFMGVVSDSVDTDSFVYIGNERRRLVIIGVVRVVRVITVRDTITVTVRMMTLAAIIITNPVISVGIGQSIS